MLVVSAHVHVPSVGLVECVTMGTFKGGGRGVLVGKSLSLMTTGSGCFTEATPFFCCVIVVVLAMVLFSSTGGGGGRGGAISITSGSALEWDLVASISSVDKPCALSLSSLYRKVYYDMILFMRKKYSPNPCLKMESIG